MEVVCLNLLITSFSLRSCHANIMPSTNGCTSLRSDSSIPCRRSWSDKYSILIWSALIECSMAKGTCLFIPSVSVVIADFSWGAVFTCSPSTVNVAVVWFFGIFHILLVLWCYFDLQGVNSGEGTYYSWYHNRESSIFYEIYNHVLKGGLMHSYSYKVTKLQVTISDFCNVQNTE